MRLGEIQEERREIRVPRGNLSSQILKVLYLLEFEPACVRAVDSFKRWFYMPQSLRGLNVVSATILISHIAYKRGGHWVTIKEMVSEDRRCFGLVLASIHRARYPLLR